MSKKAPFVAVRTDIRKEERVLVIADIAGYSRHEAMGRLIDLWAWCTDRGLEDAPDDCEGYAVSDAVVCRFLGRHGVEAILGDHVDELALGARRDDGLIYLRGTSETVSRLRALRKTSSAGGNARHKMSQGKRVLGRFASENTNQPAGHQPDTSNDQPSTIVDTSRTPATTSEIPQSTDLRMLSPARDPVQPTPAPEPILHGSRDAADRKRGLIWKAWSLGAEAFARVQSSGIDIGTPNGWSGAPPADSPPMEDLRRIIDGELIGDRPDYARAEARIANRIAVAEAEARAMKPPSTIYMSPARIWNRRSFSIAVDMSPGQVLKQRPRFGNDDPPPRKKISHTFEYEK